MLLALAGCSTSSQVAELAPEVYGLSSHGNTPAAAAQLGVARAQRHCAAMGRDFEAVRSEIGGRDYTIAFRCPRPEAPAPVAGASVAGGGAMPHLSPLPQAEAKHGARGPGGSVRGTMPAAGGVPGTVETF
jgi:hypothetical protein